MNTIDANKIYGLTFKRERERALCLEETCMKMKEAKQAHVLLLPYPAQGHINPLHQFAKRLVNKGVKCTLAITTYLSKTIQIKSGPIKIETISDGYDDEGYDGAESNEAYVTSLEVVGSRTLNELIVRHSTTEHPINCVVYDAILYWALDVAKENGTLGAHFFTQPCAVNHIYYYVHHGALRLPLTSSLVSVPGLPLLETQDVPSFASKPESYRGYLTMVLNQFSNADKADFLLVNSVYELEKEVLDTSSTQYLSLTIGPAIPSVYLDNQIEDDRDYGLSLFKTDYETMKWLEDKPPNSVIYVSFGSIVSLDSEQFEELLWGINASDCYYLWVIRADQQSKLGESFWSKISGKKGKVNEWSPQLEVLSNKATGCFWTHCGWNSTLEGLFLGVPMVAMPQVGDQPMNAKLIQDVWKVGKRVKLDKQGIARGEEVLQCLRSVMHGESGQEMRAAAKRLSRLAKASISRGGTSDKNIDEFVSNLYRNVN